MTSLEQAYYREAPIAPLLSVGLHIMFSHNHKLVRYFPNSSHTKKHMVFPLASFNIRLDLIRDTHILDIHFISHSNGSVFECMDSLTEIIAMATQNDCSILIVSAWISDPFFDTSVRDQCRVYL